MRDPAVTAGVQHRVMLGEAVGDVVGVEDRDFGGALQAACAHHPDVHPGDRQNACRTERRGRDCALSGVGAVLVTGRRDHMIRHERGQVGTQADRPHPRTSSAMGNAEGFVQVHVRDVGANVGGRGQTDLSVQIGAIHIDLSAVRMHDLADLANALFEHAMCGWIGDHQRGEPVVILPRLGAQVGDIHIAVVVARDHHHLHPAHLSRGRIGAVSRFRNQADVAPAFTTTGVITRNRDQTGVFALSPRVRLHGDRVETGDGLEIVFQAGDHLQIAADLIAGGERVQVAKLGPGDGDHLAGRVQLHRAAAERDHRMIERQITILQLLQVAQHLVFGVMGVEHRVGQNGVSAQQGDWQRASRGADRSLQLCQPVIIVRQPEQGEHCGHVAKRAGLIQRYPDLAIARLVEVVARSHGGIDDGTGPFACGNPHGVEKRTGTCQQSGFAQGSGEHCGESMDARGDGLETLWAMIDGEAPGHVGEQHLRGANVGVGLLAADMLLAGLQGHAQGRFAAAVPGDTDDPPWHGADIGFAGGEKRRMRTAESHRHPKTLRRSKRNVSAHCPRRLEQHQRHQVRRHGHDRAFGLECGNGVAQVDHLSTCVRILQQRAEHVMAGGFLCRPQDQIEPEIPCAGAHHIDGLRKTLRIHKELHRFGLAHPLGHRHGFGGCGRLVQQRGVCKFETGQVDHHLLIVEQCLQATLSNLGLIGCVGGVPARILHQIAQDHVRGEGAVIALSDQGALDRVFCSDLAQFSQRFMLWCRCRQGEWCLQPNGCRHSLVDQRGEAGCADGFEHGCNLLLVRADVATDKGVARLERRQGAAQVIGGALGCHGVDRQ